MYAATKVAQEHLLAAWAAADRRHGAAMRFHNVYGPGAPRDNPYSGVASIFLSEVLAGRPPQVTEDGGQRRDFVHVRDVAQACVAAVGPPPGRPRRRRRRRGVGGCLQRRERSPADRPRAGDRARRAGGGPAPVVTGSGRLGDVRHITAAAARAAAELGWTAQEDFTAGVAELFTEAQALADAARP